MKILFDPVYTLTDTSKCITHYALEATAEMILKKVKGSFVYYITPPPENFTFDGSRLEKAFPGRVMYVDGYYARDRFYDFVYQPQWFYNLVAGVGKLWDWDVLITTRGPAMNIVRWMNNKSWETEKRILVYEPFPVVSIKKAARNRLSSYPEMEVTTLSSYLCCDAVVLNTKYEVKGIMESARRWLSASACRDLEKRLYSRFLLPYGIDINGGKKRSFISNPDKIIGVYTQRMDATERQPDKMLDSFLYAMVTDMKGGIEFKISTNASLGMGPGERKKYSFIEFYQPSREEFYKILSQAHFCISWSIDEGMPTSILEAACFGCIPILLRRDWSEDMFGKDYPWLFQSMAEAVTYIKRMSKDYRTEYKKFVRWYDEWWLPYLHSMGAYEEVVMSMIEKNVEGIERRAGDREKRENKREDDEDDEDPRIEEILERIVAKKKLKSAAYIDLLRLGRKEKKLRFDPDDYGIGYRTLTDFYGSKPRLTGRSPSYYTTYHSLLQKTGWSEGMEVGGISIT